MIETNNFGPNDQCAHTNVDPTSLCMLRSRSNLGVLSSSRINLARSAVAPFASPGDSRPLRTKRIALLKNTFAQSLARRCEPGARNRSHTDKVHNRSGLASRKSSMPTMTRRGGATDKASKTFLSTRAAKRLEGVAVFPSLFYVWPVTLPQFPS